MQTYTGKEYKRRAKLKKALKEKGYRNDFLMDLKTAELEEMCKKLNV